MRSLLAALLILAFAAPVMAQSSMAERRYFRDWLADCRADGYCSATAYVNPSPGNGTVADYVLRIGRHAEETYWEVSLSTVATMADAALPFEVSVDGVVESFAGPAEVAAYGSINDFFLLGRKAQAVMDRLAPGATMAFAFTDTEGTAQRAEFSLSGLTASLIWIDEKQGRLGSERVAEAAPVGLAPVGESAAGAVPPALLAQHQADTECGLASDIVNGADIEVVSLSDQATLYLLPCWSGAYNFGWKAYVEQFEGEYALAAFPEFSPDTGWTATTSLVNYAWDDAEKTVSTFNKGRGIGDCGTAGTWVWDEYRFRLVEFRAKSDCDGGEPGDFPVVYTQDAP